MGKNAESTRAETWGATYSVAETTWLLLVRPGAALLIDSVDDEWRGDSTAALDEALATADPGGGVLGRLLVGGIAGLPSFAFAETTGSGWRVMVRGSATVVVGDERIDGGDYTTWAERLIAGDEIELRGGPASDGRRLPLRDGVVATNSVTLRSTGGADTSMPSAPAGATSAASSPPTAPAGSAEPTAVRSAAGRTEPEAGASGAASVAGNSAELSAPSKPEVSEAVADPVSSASIPPAPVIAPPPVDPARVSENTIADFTSSGQGDAYAHLFEETVVRPIEAAAVRESEEMEDAAPAVAPSDSDEHDGMTVLSGDLQKLRQQAATENAQRGGGAVGSEAPARLTLVFSTGQRETLSGSVIVGRSPSASKVSAGAIPRLVAIPDDPDLSRNHARVDLSGDSAVVTDLHSVNGTSIQLPGQAPQRLRAGVPSTVLPGTVIDLGGGLTITVSDEAEQG